MIFIVVKFTPRSEFVDGFPEKVRAFTEATRREPGNLWFEWSKSLEDDSYVLVEAFADGAAGDHVNSQHFKDATDPVNGIPQYLAKTPEIVSQQLDGVDGWSEMGEMTID